MEVVKTSKKTRMPVFVRLDEDTKAELDKIAEKHGSTVAAEVRRIVTSHIHETAEPENGR